jgi:hypothetical protein
MPICTYLLPLRRRKFCSAETEDWADYLALLGKAGCEVLVIDGSGPEVFRQHHLALREHCRHLPVDTTFGYLNDKVNGIHTGLALASSEAIILADDDIRYSPGNIRSAVEMLRSYDVVRPQNYLAPLPWWAKMESARMLINRAVLKAADYPGTCAFRLSAMREAGEYDGDVLFDNEEIIRHFARNGFSIAYAVDFFVEKRAPTLEKWREQRPRQAYEDFAMRVKTTTFAALIPLITILCVFASGRTSLVTLFMLALGVTALAALGRARGLAAKFFPLVSCAFAPLWVVERSISTYLAFYWHLTRGGYPFGDRVVSKGVGRDWFAGGRVMSKTIQR